MPEPLQGDVLKEIERVWGRPVQDLTPEEKAQLVSFLRAKHPQLLQAWYMVEDVPEEQEQQLRAREASKKIQQALLYEEDERGKNFLSKSKLQNLGTIAVVVLVFGVIGSFMWALRSGGGAPAQGTGQAPPPPAPTTGITPPPAEAPKVEEKAPAPPQVTPPPEVQKPPEPPKLPSLEEVPPPEAGGTPAVVGANPLPAPMASLEGQGGGGAPAGVASPGGGEKTAPQPLAATNAGGGGAVAVLGGTVPTPVASFGAPKEEATPAERGSEEAGEAKRVDFRGMDEALAGLQGGKPAREAEKPLTPGSLVPGRLAVEVALVEGGEAPVVVETGQGVFLGRARLSGGLVQAALDRAVVGGRVVPVRASLLDGGGSTLLTAEARDMAPNLAQDLLRSAFNGVSNYVEDLRQRQKVTLTDRGVVVERQETGLLEQVLGAVAAPFRMPQTGSSFVRVYRIPKGASVQVLVEEAGP